MDATVSLRERLDTAVEENRQLRELLEPETQLPPGLGLTATEARIVALLLRRAPHVVSKERIHAVLYFGEEDSPDPKIIDVLVCKIRSKLSARGVEIETVWGQGFRLGREAVGRLRALVADLAAPREAIVEEPAVEPAEPREARQMEQKSIVSILGDRVEASAVLESEEAVWPSPSSEAEQQDETPEDEETAECVTAAAEQPGLHAVDAIAERRRRVKELASSGLGQADISRKLGVSVATIGNDLKFLRKTGVL
jgi:two-component system cell cycle response regulator CtrA